MIRLSRFDQHRFTTAKFQYNVSIFRMRLEQRCHINNRISTKAIWWSLNYALKFFFLMTFFLMTNIYQALDANDVSGASLILISIAFMTIISPPASWLQRILKQKMELSAGRRVKSLAATGKWKGKAPQCPRFRDWITLRLQWGVEKFKCKTFVLKGCLSLRGTPSGATGGIKDSCRNQQRKVFNKVDG